jgi:murein L,D-transpeptidase YcbB/YkuD
MIRLGKIHRAFLVGAVLAACASSPTTETRLVAEGIRTRIEAAAGVAELRAGGEPVYASAVLPKFYERRLYRPAWSDAGGPTHLADDLVAALRRANLEGLRSEDYHLAGIEAVLAAVRTDDAKRGPALDPDRWAELDLLLTDAFLVYGAHLLGGRVNPETLSPEWVSNRRTADIAVVLEAALASGDIAGAIETLVPQQFGYRRLRAALAKDREVAAAGGWPAIPDGVSLQLGDSGVLVAALRERLRLEGDLGGGEWEGDEPAERQKADRFDATAERAVKMFQQRHGLTPDGVVNAATRAELNVPVERRVEQVELNLERWRWLPEDMGRRHIIVNIAAYELEVVDADSVVLSMRVVVGRPFSRTPVLSDTMRYIVLNPYWHVPRDIATHELLPKVRHSASFLARSNMRVFPASGPSGQEVDPSTVDWSAVTPARFPFQLRQDPGPRNALGRIKFMFLNKYHVYLHDTPAGSLFAEAQRDFSHGCIRIQDPIALAVYLLQDPLWDRDAILLALDDAVDRSVPLPQPIPIHLLYWTAWAAGDGTIQFRRDIHGRDAPLLKALRALPPSIE